MNKTKAKIKAKRAARKTGQYGVVAPAIAIGTFGYATYLGLKKIVKTTGSVSKAIATDTVSNTVAYISDVKDQSFGEMLTDTYPEPEPQLDWQ